MTAPAHLRKGWCPGALRPMESGDGLLVRVKPRAGAISTFALIAMAEAASRFGTGEIDLTNRANFQIRGVSPETHSALLSALDAAGLIDTDAATEAVRNVVVDPLCGVDPGRCDVRWLATAVEAMLGARSEFHRLPVKFGLSFSGTSEPRVGGRSADIMVCGAQSGGLEIWLDGGATGFTLASEHLVMDAVARILEVFLGLRSADARIARMKDAVGRHGLSSIYEQANLAFVTCAPAKAASTLTPAPTGILAVAETITGVGVGLPFGRVTAAQLAGICAIAIRSRIGTAHVGPQRVLVFVTSDSVDARALSAKARAVGLIVNADDPRLTADVCPGAPGCRNATTDTRRDAQRLLDSLQGLRDPGSTLHVSGCEKGCARAAPAALTLVARDGFYDVIRGGGPSDDPCLRGLAPSELEKAVASLYLERA